MSGGYHRNGASVYRIVNHRLISVEDDNGGKRYYSHDPKCHLEYIKFKDGEEWFGHNGKSAKPEGQEVSDV